MKTIRTILATFGITSLLYGLFALISMRLNPAFTGRSIFQLFRDTGFVALVIGIGCVLSFVIMTVAIVSFRDEGARKKREIFDEDDEDDFIEEETVPEDRADEADETWSLETKRKQRRALKHAEEPEEPLPDLFADDDDEQPEPRLTRSAAYPAYEQPEQPSYPAYEQQPEEAEEPLPDLFADDDDEQPEPRPTRTAAHAAYEQPEQPADPVYEQPEQPSYPAHEQQPEKHTPVLRSSFRERNAEPRESGYRRAQSWDDSESAPATRGMEDSAVRTPEQPAVTEEASAPKKWCTHCGSRIDADSAFCIYCGKRV
ncbi:MAG: zinc-ribbon domain-containing protein [Clostridia bacterium]|nr:zinc-ribbon domain-containing protein [Clostridia bacterium]